MFIHRRYSAKQISTEISYCFLCSITVPFSNESNRVGIGYLIEKYITVISHISELVVAAVRDFYAFTTHTWCAFYLRGLLSFR